MTVTIERDEFTITADVGEIFVGSGDEVSAQDCKILSITRQEREFPRGKKTVEIGEAARSSSGRM